MAKLSKEKVQFILNRALKPLSRLSRLSGIGPAMREKLENAGLTDKDGKAAAPAQKIKIKHLKVNREI